MSFMGHVARLNRSRPSADIQESRNFRGWLRVGLHFHKEVAVMGGNDIVAGKPSIQKSSQAAAGSFPREQRDDRPKADRHKPPAVCGAMSQQRDDCGAYSMPQKLVQLIGCRDPKATGPRPANSKTAGSKAGRIKR